MSTSAVVAVRQHLGAGLGASEIAAALGLSRWKAPVTLWLEKTGRQAPTPAAEPALWGNKLEPIIRAEYIERHGVEVRIPRQSEYHHEISWARATVDGYVYAPSDESGTLARSHVLECKTVGLRLASDWGEEGSEEVPDYYYTQAVWQMFVTGMRRVDFAVLLGGQRYFEVTVSHDPELEAEVVEGAKDFMRRVETNTPPDVDASDAHSRYLRSLVKQTEQPATATPEIEALAMQWRDLVQTCKRLDDEEKLLKNRLLEHCVALGASKVRTSIGQLTVSKPGEKRDRDYEALARDFCARLQLAGHPIDFDAELLKRTTITPADGSIRRPNYWTKEIK